MTDTTDDPAGTARARNLLASSEQALDDLLAAFNLMAEQVRRGDTVRKAELASAIVALTKCRTNIIEEIQKHERRVLSSAGLSTAVDLDFDAVRRDIGRRLDRLRDTT